MGVKLCIKQLLSKSKHLLEKLYNVLRHQNLFQLAVAVIIPFLLIRNKKSTKCAKVSAHLNFVLIFSRFTPGQHNVLYWNTWGCIANKNSWSNATQYFTKTYYNLVRRSVFLPKQPSIVAWGGASKNTKYNNFRRVNCFYSLKFIKIIFV